MARFGRGQPHPPILLRTAAAAAAVVAGFALQIHIIGAPRVVGIHPARDADVIILRGKSLVPDRLAPQSHVLLAVLPRAAGIHPAREADVIFLRAPAVAPAPAVKAPPSTILLTARNRGARHPGRTAHVLFQHTAPAVVQGGPFGDYLVQEDGFRITLEDGSGFLLLELAKDHPSPVHVISQPGLRAPQAVQRRAHVVIQRAPVVAVAAPTTTPTPHVVLAAASRFALHPAREADVVTLRGRSLVPDRLPRQSTVQLAVQSRLAQHPAREADVIVLRGKSLVPDRLAPQSTVLLATRSRASAYHPARDADIIFVRTAAAPVVAPTTPAPPIHVISLAPARVQHPAREADVIALRGKSLVPDRLPRQGTVILTALSRFALHPARESDVIVLRTAPPPPVVAATTPTPHVILAAANRFALHPAREADVIIGRGQPSKVPDRLAPQITIISPVVERRAALDGLRGAHAIVLRNVPTPPAPAVKARAPTVISLAANRFVYTIARGKVVVLRTAPIAIAPPAVVEKAVGGRRPHPTKRRRKEEERAAAAAILALQPPVVLNPEDATIIGWIHGDLI